MRIVYAGKAHPDDGAGSAISCSEIVGRSPTIKRFAGRVFFVEDYDMDVARYLT